MENFNIKLSQAQLNLVVKGLLELPAKESLTVIETIRVQVIEQSKKVEENKE